MTGTHPDRIRKNRTTRFGFTLIEILIVVSIISIFASIGVASLADARAQARDLQRVVQFREIVNALDEYYFRYGCYPPDIRGPDTSVGWMVSGFNGPANSDSDYSTSPGDWENNGWHPGGLYTLVSTGILPKLPTDPVNRVFMGGDFVRLHFAYEPFCTLLHETGSFEGCKQAYSLTVGTESKQYTYTNPVDGDQYTINLLIRNEGPRSSPPSPLGSCGHAVLTGGITFFP